TSFLPLSFIASILFISSGATYGTFLLDLDILFFLLFQDLLFSSLNNKFISSIIFLSSLVSKCWFTPRCHWSCVSYWSFTFTTTMWVIYWVHNRSSNFWSPTHMSFSSC